MPELATCRCDDGWIITGDAARRCPNCADRPGARATGAATALHELAGGKLRRLDLAAMRKSPPPPVDWIVDGLVARANVTLLAGREGLGKSMLALAIAAALSRGGDVVGGMRVRGAGAVLLDAENGPQEVARRTHALDLHDDGVTYLEPAAGEFDLVEDHRGLRDVVQAAAPALLVIDSLRTLWRGDEYDPREGAQVTDGLRRIARACDCGVLVLHGVSRSAGEYSGNTALGHGVQLVYTLRREQHDEHPGRRVLCCHKTRVGAAPPDRWLAITPAGDHVAIAASSAPNTKGHASGQPGPIAHTTKATDWASTARRALSAGPLDRAAIAHAVGADVESGTFKRALRTWVSEGTVIRVDRGRYGLPEPADPQKGHESGQAGPTGPTGPIGPLGQGAFGPWPNGPNGPNVDGPNDGPNLRVIRTPPPAAQRDMEARQ